jgi:hypothetical protein
MKGLTNAMREMSVGPGSPSLVPVQEQASGDVGLHCSGAVYVSFAGGLMALGLLKLRQTARQESASREFILEPGFRRS